MGIFTGLQWGGNKGLRRWLLMLGLLSLIAGGVCLHGSLATATTAKKGAAKVGQTPSWHLIPAFPHLQFQDPLMLLPVPRSKLLCVIGREGTVEFFDADPAATTKTLVLDLRAHTQGWNDSGLLGIAFHPDFGKANSPNAGYFYVWYNYAADPVPAQNIVYNTHTYDRLVRYTIPPGQTTADPQSAVVLIDQFDRGIWHNGGGMFFDRNGFLFLSLGDGGFYANSLGNAQLVGKGLFSGVVRLDVNKNTRLSHPIPRQPANGITHDYLVPNDNPWVGRKATLEEFYAIGLRSPHRMTYDAATDTIFCGDVGESKWEEINIIEKGCNYQWAYREGVHQGPSEKPDETLGKQRPPLYSYPHADFNNCVIGGYVYRGKVAPSWQGQYFFGDYVSGRIWAMSGWQQGKPVVQEVARMDPGLTSFGYDAQGELYALQIGAPAGMIYKLVP